MSKNYFENITTAEERRNQTNEYYAMPRYITTNDLIKMFKESDGTMQGFIKAAAAELEI